MAGRGMREKALYLSFSYPLDDCFERVIKIERGGGGRKKEKRGRKEKTKREKKKERREKKKKERDEELRECL